MTEKRLISMLKAKEKKALDILIEKYSSYVYTIIRNIIGGVMPSQDIEEICADCFIKIWQISENLDEKQGLSPYIAACARNCARSRLRGLHDDYSTDELFEDIVSPQSLSDNFETAEQIKLVSQCLDGLSDNEKEIFVRFYYYGEKIKDICQKLQMSESACKTRLCRTREKLRKYLAERGYENEKK
ncbi:MAG: RNA polymerase sigma factor [Hominimerdicola sp.]